MGPQAIASLDGAYFRRSTPDLSSAISRQTSLADGRNWFCGKWRPGNRGAGSGFDSNRKRPQPIRRHCHWLVHSCRRSCRRHARTSHLGRRCRSARTRIPTLDCSRRRCSRFFGRYVHARNCAFKDSLTTLPQGVVIFNECNYDYCTVARTNHVERTTSLGRDTFQTVYALMRTPL